MYIYIYIYIFGIPTFSVSRKTHFQDSHFQRLLKHIFDFGFFTICGVLNHGKSWE